MDQDRGDQSALLEMGVARQLPLFTSASPLLERIGAEFFHSLVAEPGVYFFYDEDDRLLYIGQSGNLKARLNSYRNVSPDRHPKRTLKLVTRVRRIDLESHPTAAHAIAREAELLLKHRPPFNRAGVWRGEPWWLLIEPSAAGLKLKLNRQAVGLGPLPAGFRHWHAPLLRALSRLANPDLGISSHARQLFQGRGALEIVLRMPARMADDLMPCAINWVHGDASCLLAALARLPEPQSSQERDFWADELEILQKAAAKLATFRIPPESVKDHGPDDADAAAEAITKESASASDDLLSGVSG